MTDPLLDRLVKDGVLSPDDASRVAERVARGGGSVDGALLELQLVSPARLPEILARVTGLPAPPEAAFTAPDARARRVFPAKVAERHAIAPFALEGRELSVVTPYPPDTSLLDEIGITLSLHLRAHVAPEWRVRALVRQLYGGSPSGRAAVPGVPADPAPLPLQVEEVVAPVVAPFAWAGPDAGPGDETRAPGWSPEEAREALAAADGPDAAIRVALRAARDRFAFAAAFGVRRDGVVGQDALGVDPRAREACRRIAVDPASPGLFGPPLETRAPYLGPPPADPVTAAVLSGLGRVSPRTVLVAPVLLGERVACLLYADDDDEPVSSGSLGELFPLLGALGEALARMIRERKSGAEVAPGPAAPAPVDPAPGTPRPAEPAARPVPTSGDPSPGRVAIRPGPVPGEDWSVVEPARAEPEPLRFAVDVDLGEYEVISAGEALATARAEDLPAIVEALAASQRDSEDRRELLARLGSGGPEAAAVLVERLPGPVEAGGSLESGIPVEAWGPIFEGVAAAGGAAERPLQALLSDPDPERRRAALALLARLGVPGTLPALAARVQDDDPGVAAEAARAVAAARGSPVHGTTVAEIRRALASGRPVKASRAARALAILRDADSVPVLIHLLDSGGELAEAASDALTAITLQRLGPDAIRWIAWWREWRAAPRASWLFQALASPEPDLRRRAAAELRLAGDPPEPYDPDGPEAERQRAARSWASWWREEGLAL